LVHSHENYAKLVFDLNAKQAVITGHAIQKEQDRVFSGYGSQAAVGIRF
jgi:hypothetical protein